MQTLRANRARSPMRVCYGRVPSVMRNLLPAVKKYHLSKFSIHVRHEELAQGTFKRGCECARRSEQRVLRLVLLSLFDAHHSQNDDGKKSIGYPRNTLKLISC